MQIGDTVIHRETGKRMTIKELGSGEFVLCAWMEAGFEATSVHNWQELRAVTASDSLPGLTEAMKPSAPVFNPEPEPEGEPETEGEGERVDTLEAAAVAVASPPATKGKRR